MVRNKVVKYFFIVTLFLLSACGIKKNYQDLTVSELHSNIIRYKTTSKEIKKSYGEPYKTIKGISRVEEIYKKINNTEGVNDYLDDLNYWQTIEENTDSDINPNASYELCYEYRGKELGVKSVYFFMTDNKVMTYLFDGEITDKSAAQKDKYLRQILDEDK